jgi:predicted esterase
MRHETSERPAAHEHHVTVTRTARYYTFGDVGPSTYDVWIACHGYGQLAAEFVARLTALRAPERLVVAPEGLSRFYLERARSGSHATSPVGASWMTREDRAAEIGDQVAYLDAIVDAFKARASQPLHLTALGFSQGVATVCRWLAHSRTRAERLVCWGGVMPDDILSGDIRMFRTTRIWLVAGSRDEFATPERLNDTASTMRRVGLQVTQLSFDGGHRLDDETLVRLATAHTIDGRSTPGSSVAAGPQNRTVTPNQQPDQGGGG